MKVVEMREAIAIIDECAELTDKLQRIRDGKEWRVVCSGPRGPVSFWSLTPRQATALITPMIQNRISDISNRLTELGVLSKDA